MFGLPDQSVGAVVAALIAALVSLVGLIISKEHKVSEFRQAWIDALREEVATIITNAHAVHGVRLRTDDNSKRLEYTEPHFLAMNDAWAKIKLRLNPTEKASIGLLNVLDGHAALFQASSPPLSHEAMAPIDDELVKATNVVLKQEWLRVRKGEVVYRSTVRVLFAVVGLFVTYLLCRMLYPVYNHIMLH